MISCVLDASTALSWFFEDEQTSYSLAILDNIKEFQFDAPVHFPFEIANALIMAERRKRIAMTDVDSLLEALFSLDIKYDLANSHNLRSAAKIARSQGISFYDAAYLELAQRLNQPLASLDSRLIQSACQLGVSVFQAADPNISEPNQGPDTVV